MSTQYNQCQIEYMQANGATSGEKGLCTKQFLLAQGVADAALGDMWYEYLTPAYPGGYSRTAMEQQFWYDMGCRAYDAGLPAGIFELHALQGWTGLEECGAITYLGTTVTYLGSPVTYTP